MNKQRERELQVRHWQEKLSLLLPVGHIIYKSGGGDPADNTDVVGGLVGGGNGVGE